MAVLGLPYEIEYLSTGVSNLTDVVGFVRKPDGSVVGPFHFSEGFGAFKGCYFAEYFTSLTDIEGRYFVRIFSPTEGRNDSTSFDLQLDGSGAVVTADQRVPSQLLGLVSGATLVGYVTEVEKSVVATVPNEEIRANIYPEPSVLALVDGPDREISGRAGAKTIQLELERY